MSDKDIAVLVGAYYYGMAFNDRFVDISLIPKSGVTLDIVEKELENSIDRFLHEKITDKELESAKYRTKSTI